MKNNKYIKFKNRTIKIVISTFVVGALIVINQSKQKITYLNELKTDITGLQDNLAAKQEEIDLAKTERQAALDGIQRLEGNYTALKQQTDEMSKQLDNKQAQIANLTEDIIGDKVKSVVDAILKEDFKKLSKLINPEKGLRLSPTSIVDIEKHRVIESTKISSILNDSVKYEWGLYDAQGNQILLTGREYFEKYVKDTDCLINGKVQYASDTLNKSRQVSAQSINENDNVYSEGVYVDYLYEGTESNNYTDWKSVRFIFEQYQSTWYLTGIITNKS